MNETWKSIIGYEGLYEVSDCGLIKSLRRIGRKKEILLKLRRDPNGYMYATLCKDQIHKTERIHKLVLEAFVSLRPFQYQCNHKNGIKSDNRLENLEWITPSQNHKHRCRVLYPGCNQGSKHSQSKITENDVSEIRKRINEGEKYCYIAKDFNISESTICDIKRKKTWGHI